MTAAASPADLAGLGRLDTMRLVGIEAWAHHGVFAQERRDGQLFRLDVTWWQDLGPAGATDDLARTTDYGQLAGEVVRLVQGQPVDLIETLADQVGRGLLQRFGMDYVQVTVHKPDAPLPVGVQDVALTAAVLPRARPPRPVVLSLGSNLEPRVDYLQFGVAALASTAGLDRPRVSPVYQTAPHGVEGQPDYLNAVLVADTAWSAPALWRRCADIEAAARRSRQVEHGPRTLDIDLIALGTEVWDLPEVTIPHPRAAGRRFVLLPWLDLDPGAELGGVAVAQLAAQVGDQVVRPAAASLFLP
jgi:dihydroneopterin aldolase/2-amino-4-hydroxy-6-hydroxymethyldihydropteridine diphosphokinase